MTHGGSLPEVWGLAMGSHECATDLVARVNVNAISAASAGFEPPHGPWGTLHKVSSQNRRTQQPLGSVPSSTRVHTPLSTTALSPFLCRLTL